MKQLLTEEQKAKYWANRKAGKRGQEPLPAPVLAKDKDGNDRISDVEMRMTKHGLVANPRYMRRRKVVDRHFTKKGFVAVFNHDKREYVAVRISSKMHNIIQHFLRRAELEVKAGV